MIFTATQVRFSRAHVGSRHAHIAIPAPNVRLWIVHVSRRRALVRRRGAHLAARANCVAGASRRVTLHSRRVDGPSRRLDGCFDALAVTSCVRSATSRVSAAYTRQLADVFGDLFVHSSHLSRTARELYSRCCRVCVSYANLAGHSRQRVAASRRPSEHSRQQFGGL